MSNLPEPVCIQVWSLQGLTPERKQQYDDILNDQNVAIKEDKPRGNVEKNLAEIVPWQSQLETIEYIKQVAARLRQFCDSPLRTAKVRAILKEAKVIGNVPRNYGKHTTKSIKKALKKKRRTRSDGLN